MESSTEGEQSREESAPQEETRSEPQDPSGMSAAEAADSAAPQQPDSQDAVGPESQDRIPPQEPDHGDTGVDPAAAAQSDPVALLAMDFENLLQDEEEGEEGEEELTILDSDHPLVKRHQAALTGLLLKRLHRTNLVLNEKLEQEKADTKYMLDTGLDMSTVKEQLDKLHIKQRELNRSKGEAAAKRQQGQDRLQAIKNQHSSLSSRRTDVKNKVSKLQEERDDLMLHLIFTKGVTEDLQSNAKVMKNVRSKVGAEKTRAEEQKLKQDLLVERLTKDNEKLVEQIALCEAQTRAQAEDTQAAKGALSESELELESLIIARNQLMQHWTSSLLEMGRQDEALGAMQEAVRMAHDQINMMNREIEGFKKETLEEQEHNEMLTMQLHGSRMDCAAIKKRINQKLAQKEVLQAHYSNCIRVLKTTERTLTGLLKETSNHQSKLNDQRKQMEKESALRLDMEDKIMTHIQHQITHNRAAKYSERLASNVVTLKKERMEQLWQLEHEIAVVALEASEVRQHLDTQMVSLAALDAEINKYNNQLTADQAKISSFFVLIRQKQDAISNYKKKITDIAAITGHVDLSPFEIKIQALTSQIEELTANIKSDQQLWMRQQGVLVELTQDLETNNKQMIKLQMENTGMQQKKIRLDSLIEAECREERDLMKKSKALKGDLEKLNTLVSKNKQLNVALEQENALMRTDYLQTLKEQEKQVIEMQMNLQKLQEEKERLLDVLMEAERQIGLWEKKLQLVKETRSTVGEVQDEIKMMKKEIHRMEVRFNSLMRQREQLMRQSETSVDRRGSIFDRCDAKECRSHKQSTQTELLLIMQGLRRRLQDSNRNLADSNQASRELQAKQATLSDRLVQQKQQLTEVSSINYALDTEEINLQDAKERNLANLVTLQNRGKMLKAVSDGSYRASSTEESIEAALQSQVDRVNAIGAIVQRVCEEFPQHQGALRKLSRTLAEFTNA